MNHITSKVALGLAVAAVLTVGILTFDRKPDNETVLPTGYVLPELRDHLDDVRTIRLTVAEDKPAVTLIKQGQGWTVQEKAGYAADSGKLRAWLSKLADASLLQAKTANPQRHTELGVEDIKSKDAKGVLVSLEGLVRPAQLIIGNYYGKANGSFVRRPDDQQSWLAKGNLGIERDPAQWLDKALVDIGSDRIAEILLTRPGGKSLRLFKAQAGDAAYQLADLPGGSALDGASVASGPASVLAGLNLLDVPSAQQTPPDEQLLKASYRTFDGMKLDVQAWKQDDKHYARFMAVLEQAKAEERILADQSRDKAAFEAKQKTESTDAPLSVADSAKDREQRLARLAAEVGGLSQRFSGRVFVIPSHVYSSLDKSDEDLLIPAQGVQTGGKAEEPEAEDKPKR